MVITIRMIISISGATTITTTTPTPTVIGMPTIIVAAGAIVLLIGAEHGDDNVADDDACPVAADALAADGGDALDEAVGWASEVAAARLLGRHVARPHCHQHTRGKVLVGANIEPLGHRGTVIVNDDIPAVCAGRQQKRRRAAAGE